jgi:probable HAF family extracellular repeat protein
MKDFQYLLNTFLKPVTIIVLASIASTSVFAATYTFKDLSGVGGGSFSYPFAINNKNQVAGTFLAPNGEQRAALWKENKIIDLGTLPGGNLSKANDINDNGQIVGLSSISSGQSHAVLWNDKKISDLGTYLGNSSTAYSINNIGRTLGSSNTIDSSTGIQNGSNITIWYRGTTSALSGGLGGTYGSQAYSINNSGQIVGYSTLVGDQAQHTTLWSNGSVTDLGSLGGSVSSGRAINNLGQIAGYSYTTGDSVIHATLWKNGTITDLGALNGANSVANAINIKGQVVGTNFDINTPIEAQFLTGSAFIWENGVSTNLNALVVNLKPNITIVSATDINDSGVIVGAAIDNNIGIPFAYMLTPVKPIRK